MQACWESVDAVCLCVRVWERRREMILCTPFHLLLWVWAHALYDYRNLCLSVLKMCSQCKKKATSHLAIVFLSLSTLTLDIPHGKSLSFTAWQKQLLHKYTVHSSFGFIFTFDYLFSCQVRLHICANVCINLLFSVWNFFCHVIRTTKHKIPRGAFISNALTCRHGIL